MFRVGLDEKSQGEEASAAGTPQQLAWLLGFQGHWVVRAGQRTCPGLLEEEGAPLYIIALTFGPG